jgi:hypothetical protein
MRIHASNPASALAAPIQAPSAIDVTHDPSQVRQDYVKEFTAAVAQNTAKVATYLQTQYGVSQSQIDNHQVRLRILSGQTVFGNRGHVPTAAEKYSVQVELKGAGGEYVPKAPETTAYVNWQRNSAGNVSGFGLTLLPGAQA